jgi:hypothetical protein
MSKVVEEVGEAVGSGSKRTILAPTSPKQQSSFAKVSGQDGGNLYADCRHESRVCGSSLYRFPSQSFMDSFFAKGEVGKCT